MGRAGASHVGRPVENFTVRIIPVVPAGGGLLCRIDVHRLIGMNRLSRRRPTWDVTWGILAMLIVPTRGGLLCRVGVHRRIEGAEDARACLGREPSVQDEGAIILVPESEAATLVLCIGLLGLLCA